MRIQGGACRFALNGFAGKHILLNSFSVVKHEEAGINPLTAGSFVPEYGKNNVMKALKILISIAFFIYSISSYAWSLKTHIWISEQVLNDVLDDGKVTIDGHAYDVPNHIYIALKEHPDYYRMGNIGPDGFPDPIVGQITTHPGVDGGWQTGEWLNHLLKNARSSSELAFAYGFIGHAAGDIFAHTYVNAYAGDIFDLTDSDQSEVELRHFVLEKFIEARTPSNWNSKFSVPSDFLRQNFIYDGGVQTQYFKSRKVPHLLAMSGAKNAVREFGKGVDDIIGRLTELGVDLAKQLSNLQADLLTAKFGFNAAQETLNGAKQVLSAKEKLYQFQLDTLRETIKIINENPSLISAQEQIAAEQLKIAANAVDEASNLSSRVSDLRKTYNNLQYQLSNTVKYFTVSVCDEICDTGLIPFCRDVCNVVEKVTTEYSNLYNRVNNAHNTLIDVENQLTQALARELSANIRRGEAIARKLALEKELLARQALILTHEAAVAATELELSVDRSQLEIAQKAFDEAKKIRDQLDQEVRKLIGQIDKIKDVVDQYNPLTLYIRNWESDIDKATSAYIDTGKSAALLMLNNESGALNEYLDWYQCWKPVYTGVPAVVPQAVCVVKDQIEHIKGEIDRIIASLPEELQWVLFPTRKIQQIAEEELKPHLEELSKEVLGFLTNPQTAEFIFLLASPENATKDKLNSVYSKDRSGKGLLEFERVSDLVEKDLDLGMDDKFNPNTFIPARNAVTLAKLALLEPNELNKLHRTYVPYGRTLYGSELYSPSVGNFSLLIDAIKSIDGNHQWQAYGLPYTRREKNQISGAVNSFYGYDFYKDSNKGFRFWVDPKAREQVFLKIFPAPGVSGFIRNLPQLKDPHYPFQECEVNPYPETQNSSGNIVRADYRCKTASMSPLNPKKWFYYLKQNALLEFDCKRFSAAQKMILIKACE